MPQLEGNQFARGVLECGGAPPLLNQRMLLSIAHNSEKTSLQNIETLNCRCATLINTLLQEGATR